MGYKDDDSHSHSKIDVSHDYLMMENPCAKCGGHYAGRGAAAY
jgi:hypothetical protein